nr:immunoglobulin light chain junction region [Macaca mulatta]
CQHAYGTPYSF